MNIKVILKKRKSTDFFLQLAFLIFLTSGFIFAKIASFNIHYKILYIIFIGVYGLKIIRRKKAVKEACVLFWLGFAFFSTISLFWSFDMQIRRVIVIWMMTCVLIVCINIVRTKKQWDILIYATIIAVWLETLFVIYNVGIKDMLAQRYVFGTFNSNELGVQLAYISILSLYLSSKGKRVYILSYILSCLMTLITGSRTAFLLMLSGNVIYYLANSDTKTELVKKIWLCIMFFCSVSLLIFGTDTFYNLIGKRVWGGMILPLWDKFNGVEIYYNDAQISNRLRGEFARYAWEAFVNNPIIGLGIDNFRFYLREVSGVETYAHSNYLEILADLGIMGFILYYSPYFFAGINFLKKEEGRKKEDRLAFALYIMLLLENITSVQYYLLFSNVVFLIILLNFKGEK